MALVASEAELARVGKNYSGVVESLRHVIDHQVVQSSILTVFLLYKHAVAVYLVVEHALRNVEFRRFLTHGKHQRPHLHLRLWQHIVLKKERADSHKGYQHHQRPHCLQQRHARRLHSRQLKPFAEIAEEHQRRQQNRQRQCQRHHRERGIKKQLGYDGYLQSFSNKVVDKTPQELHQHDKQTDAERHHEQGQEPLQHKTI